mgnify:CR=1 FL=1
MAKANTASAITSDRTTKRTSIGESNNSQPNNKHHKRMKKPYRGQGK